MRTSVPGGRWRQRWLGTARRRSAAAGGLVLSAGLACGAAVALGQEPPKPEQLQKMYDDALGQLKAAQERKNQLAQENDKLQQQLAELKKQVEQMQGRMEEMKRTDAEHAERSFFLRSHYAAWQAFIRQYPELEVRWRLFLGAGDLMTTPKSVPSVDVQWPTGGEDS